ncbi:Ctr copper transporter family-domain-containing protein [Scheffersomyces coipomensis]|uniref:Ctr copper transporter family-domain-containing protein n=1 Tax=Scheffersomyces coipomensis TaxID=1788519 RepID=UPI00315CAC4F
MNFDHSDMGHHIPVQTSDMGHSMPGMEDKCSMNMLFTWDWQNTCVVFRWWHIKSFTGFILSFIAIVVITSGYEFLKSWFGQWQRSYSNTLSGSAVNTTGAAINRFKLKRSLFYGIQVGYSFLLMLVFMTYNGWLMIAVAIGAAVGNFFWGGIDVAAASRDLSCH